MAEPHGAGLILRGSLLLAAVFISVGLGGCAFLDFGSGQGIERKVDKVVWELRDNYVRLERQDVLKGKTLPPNAHPVNILADRLKTALAKIQVKHSNKDRPAPLFSEWELDQLSSHISAGLAEARPNQDVTFAIVGWHKGGLGGLKQPTVTTGRVFYQGGQLNLILGEAQRATETGENLTRQAQADRRLDPYVPGMRGFTKRHDWVLVTEPGSGIHRPPGTNRSDWVVLSPRALTAAPTAVSARGGAPAAAASEVELLRRELEQLRREVRGGAGAPGYSYPSTAPAQPAQTYSPAPTAQVPGTADPNARQRLIVLDDLRNRGLISDEEYQVKRQRILSGF